MNVNGTLFCGLIWLVLTLMGFAGELVGKSYSVRGITFFDNGFPKHLKIRLFGHTSADFHPCQAVVTAERKVTEGVEKVSIVEMLEGIEVVNVPKAGERDDQEIIDITMNLESCLPLKFFDQKNPEKWSLAEISGPRIPLKENAAFVPIIVSKNHLIGFVLAPTKGDKGIRQWEKSFSPK